MVRVSQIQNSITYQYHEFFVFAKESASERAVRRLNNYTLTYPLPELLLRRPEFFPIAADYDCCFLFLGLLLRSLFNHTVKTTRSQRNSKSNRADFAILHLMAEPVSMDRTGSGCRLGTGDTTLRLRRRSLRQLRRPEFRPVERPLRQPRRNPTPKLLLLHQRPHPDSQPWVRPDANRRQWIRSSPGSFVRRRPAVSLPFQWFLCWLKE